MKTNKKWYQTTSGIILLLVLFFPIGLYLMWKHATWNKTVKWIVTGVFAFAVLVNAVSGSNSSSTTSNTQSSTPTISQETEQTTQPVTTAELEQTPEPTKTPVKTTNSPVPAPTKQSEPVSSETVSQKNAVRKAKSYLSISGFSRNGLVAQLEYEKFSHDDAVYGADNSGANWNEQAAKKAKSYMDISAFSRGSLIEQLKYDKFTQEQAEYGANAVGL